MNIRPNAKCKCGSGKKYKNCCGDPSRQKSAGARRTLLIDLGEQRAISGFSPTLNGEFHIIDEHGKRIAPASYWLETSRPRNSTSTKKKVLNFVNHADGHPMVNPDAILRSYDFVFCVDTNYPKEDGPKSLCLTLACLVHTDYKVFPPISGVYALSAFEFRQVTCPPERLGWKQSIETILRSEFYKTGMKLLLIVDAHLGDISDINQRKTAILDDFFLPEGFTLFYASADTGRAFAVSQIMKSCDKHAAELKQAIASGLGGTENLNAAGIPHASRFRLWTFDI